MNTLIIIACLFAWLVSMTLFALDMKQGRLIRALLFFLLATGLLTYLIGITGALTHRL